MTFRQRKVLALIPARGGSKGVKRKNLRVVGGKPLIAHTINAAQGSAILDKVYVSSEDQEILSVARAMGAETILRSVDAASDTATPSQVVFDFLTHVGADLLADDPYLVYLQPTSPLRTSAHIDAAFAEMAAKGSTACLSVTELTKSPYKSFILDPEGHLQALFGEEKTNSNRQELPAVYYPNGAIYIFPVSKFIGNGGFPSNGGVPFLMSEHDSIDVDSEEDLRLIETRCPQK